MSWPASLRINAWTGEAAAEGGFSSGKDDWARTKHYRDPDQDMGDVVPPALADKWNWDQDDTGWGLILPEDLNELPTQKAIAADAPECLRGLVEQRGAPVFRYLRGQDNCFQHLKRYYRDGSSRDLSLSGTAAGRKRLQMPLYLLIYGGPDVIPWELQYILNANRRVGRLHLVGNALENYIEALQSDWSEGACRSNHTVVWSVEHGKKDITRLLRIAIAQPLHKKFRDYAHIGENATFIDGETQEATVESLAGALASQNPGLIVTTSHGMTGPLDPELRDEMLGNLGMPVDEDHKLVTPTKLGSWSPGGAIWYAHACCSAGSDSPSVYADLVEPNSDIERVVQGVANLGPQVSPLPTALLGHTSPLRAFVGQVEPTFDWTLMDPETKQKTTSDLHTALYSRLYQPWPIAHALRPWYAQIGALAGQHVAAVNADKHGDLLDYAAWSQIAMRDRQSMVVLGDPTACLPELG